MNWLDVVTLTIIAVASIRGYLEGFVASLLNVAGIVAGIIAARLYFMEVAQFLMDNTRIYNKILQMLSRSVGDTTTFLENYGLREVFGTGGNVASTVTLGIIYIISIFIVYFAVRFAFALLVGLLNSLMELPVLRQFNKLGGVVVGFVKGVLGVIVMFAFVVPLIQLFSVKWVEQALSQSVVARYFYKYNFIMSWVVKRIMNIF